MEELLDDLRKLDDLAFASIKTRIKAFCIDLIIISFINGVFFIEWMGIKDSDPESAPITILLFVAYFALTEGSTFKASFGKWVYGITVQTLDRKRMGFLQALLRQFVKLLTFGFSFLSWYGVLRSKTNQALHDYAAKTIVLDTNTAKKANEWEEEDVL